MIEPTFMDKDVVLLSHELVLAKYLNLVLQSAYIPNTQILSTILIAKAGLGKTNILTKIKDLDCVEYTIDMTPKLIVEFLKHVESDGKKFLILPDYIATLGHSKKTKDLARTFFRAMMEEGIKDNNAYGMELHLRKDVHAGLISAITPEFYESNQHIWRSDGFLSRFLPFSYSHSPNTERSIINGILNKQYDYKDYTFTLKMKDVIEPEKDSMITAQIESLSFQIKDRNVTPYRPIKQVTALCNASAILRQSDKVEQQDIELVTVISQYINKKEYPI